MSFLFLLGLKIREKKKQIVHERQRKTVLQGEEMTLRVGGVGGGGVCDKDAQKNNKKKKDEKKNSAYKSWPLMHNL